MPVTRKNCVVLDTSVLPRRPSIAEIKQFLDCELKLDMTLVRSIQTHNVKNVVYMAMQSEEVAIRIAVDHHLKHCMDCGGTRHTIPLPIYIDSSAVDVKLHDLPEEIDNHTITSHMQQYGEVISIRNDVWRSYFPGISNGVRILRMKLTAPIPSYITILEHVTMTTYLGQQRSCKNCGGKEHPKLRCSEAAASTSNQPNKRQSQQPNKPVGNKNSSPLNVQQWPSLSKPETSEMPGEKNKEKKASNKQEPKRQRSIDSDTSSIQAPKRVAPSVSVSSQSDSSEAVSDGTLAPTQEEVVYAGTRYRRSSFSWIEDEAQRQQLIEETQRRIEELIQQSNGI